jgi:hypothetical protein
VPAADGPETPEVPAPAGRALVDPAPAVLGAAVRPVLLAVVVPPAPLVAAPVLPGVAALRVDPAEVRPVVRVEVARVAARVVLVAVRSVALVVGLRAALGVRPVTGVAELRGLVVLLVVLGSRVRGTTVGRVGTTSRRPSGTRVGTTRVIRGAIRSADSCRTVATTVARVGMTGAATTVTTAVRRRVMTAVDTTATAVRA